MILYPQIGKSIGVPVIGISGMAVYQWHWFSRGILSKIVQDLAASSAPPNACSFRGMLRWAFSSLLTRPTTSNIAGNC